MECEGFDGGESVVEHVPAVGEEKKCVIVEGELDPEAQGTSGENEQADNDPVAHIPFSVV